MHVIPGKGVNDVKQDLEGTKNLHEQYARSVVLNRGAV